MVWNVIGIIVSIIYFAFNFLTANIMSAKRMKQEFINGQCMVGKICANIFYAPAWILKGIKVIVLETIA